MAIEDDDKPRKKITHEIGQDLSLLSVEELTERIALMTSEIERLQQAGSQKARVEGCGEQLFQVVEISNSLSHVVAGQCRRCDHPRHLAGRWPIPHHDRRGYESRVRGDDQCPNSANGRHGKQSLKKIARLRSIKLSPL